MNRYLTKKLLVSTLVGGMMLATVTGCQSQQSPESSQVETTQDNQSNSIPQATSPMGDRPIIHVNGVRFVLLNDGKAFVITEEQVGDAIEVVEGLNAFEFIGYDTDFRFLIENDGEYYIAQYVGNEDDSPMDVERYFELADLENNTQLVDVFDHVGRTILKTVEGEDVTVLLEAIKGATIEPLTNEQNEAIASAQANGESFMVAFALDDWTEVSFYVMPSLNLVTVGDYTCTVESLNEQVGYIFEGLEQGDQPLIMN